MNIEVFSLHEGMSNATLTAYIQDNTMDHGAKVFRPAIVICPGGAYIGHTEKEAEPVALRFVSAGYHAFVLRYSIGAGVAKFPAPFRDAAKAIMMIRENAEKWCVNPTQISICGFSTGGHVAATLAASWQDEYLAEALQAEPALFKPNALILAYPLLDMNLFKRKNSGKSPQMDTLLEMIFIATYGTLNPSKFLMEEWACKNRITSHMPPTFLWTTGEDALVDVEENLEFIKVLAAHSIPFEFHIFEKGEHGLSLADQTVGYTELAMKGHVNAHKWVDLALCWLANHK